MCEIRFDYMAVVGNSGTGKTTFVKTLVNSMNWDKLYVCDPNRQYGDYTVDDGAKYISPNELQGALNIIGKRLLLMQKRGVMVIEDLNFTLSRLSETLEISLRKAKKLIKLLLENLRKYDVKVIIVMHEIDKDLVPKCETKVFFQVPLSSYYIRKYSKIFNVDMNEVVGLSRFNYILKNGSEVERGQVQALESHEQIEKDKSFMVKHMLSKCHSLIEKVLVLRLHLDMKNHDIAEMLELDLHTVENLVWRLRKRGIAIPDGRKTFRLEKLAF